MEHNNMDVRTSMAFHKGATTVSDFGTLASAEGVPLAHVKGEHQVVVLFSPPCCSLHASTDVPQHSGPITSLYDTAEHVITVAGCHLQTSGGQKDALSTLLPVGPNLNLTYGQVIALGGDFYGDPNQAVSDLGNQADQIAKFNSNFNSLASSNQVSAILQVAQKYEFAPISQYVAKGYIPSGVYAGMTTSLGHVVPDEDRAFDEATGGTLTQNGRYLNLASYNLDHFGVDAITCYMAGHILAQQEAQKATSSPSPDAALLRAYAINAFADHFLTDLFAAGHMRTPRRKLYNYSSVLTAIAAGLCAKSMHDEDNKFGLWVNNARGDSWVAFGDARYRDPQNAANRQIMKMAIQQSMNDVWNAFAKGAIAYGQNCEVLKYLPTLINDIQDPTKAQASRDDRRNWSPLFWWNPSDNWIYVRGVKWDYSDMTDISVRDHTARTGAVLNAIAGGLQFRSILMPQEQYSPIPYPPQEAGPSGQIGWPATGPTFWQSVTGPDLRSVRWSVDRTPGPTAPTLE